MFLTIAQGFISQPQIHKIHKIWALENTLKKTKQLLDLEMTF